MAVQLPDRARLGQHMASCLIQPIHRREEWMNDCVPTPSARMVMGYRLPSWQRPFVWTHEQKVRLIESLWLGLNIGTYTFNRHEDPSLDDLLIDGQQRMKAIEEYVTDQLAVYGGLWSELSRPQQRRFEMLHFHCYITESGDEEYLRAYYDMMNFGGTAHTDADRAGKGE